MKAILTVLITFGSMVAIVCFWLFVCFIADLLKRNKPVKRNFPKAYKTYP